jgi:hypothetical protein
MSRFEEGVFENIDKENEPDDFKPEGCPRPRRLDDMRYADRGTCHQDAGSDGSKETG